MIFISRASETFVWKYFEQIIADLILLLETNNVQRVRLNILISQSSSTEWNFRKLHELFISLQIIRNSPTQLFPMTKFLSMFVYVESVCRNETKVTNKWNINFIA